MATNPSFIATPRIGVGSVDTANTNRDGTGTIADVITGAASGTRILEVVLKADGDPADCTIVLYLYDGSNSIVFDEIDLGNPAAGSATVASYRSTVTYSNLVLPSASWKLQASITAAPTTGTVKVIALGGDL
jgi:hypothetical protein